MATIPPKQTAILPLSNPLPAKDTAPVSSQVDQPSSEPSDILVCPACHAPYSAQAVICSHCGRLLTTSAETVHVNLSDAYQQPDNPQWGKAFTVRDKTIVTHTLVLVVEGQQLTLPNAQTVILGRGPAADDGLPLVDLTPFEATAKGVSRRHVEVKVVAPLTYVTDLNSSNGTWLNGTRLLASAARVLRSGDELLLGQLKIVVRFVVP